MMRPVTRLAIFGHRTSAETIGGIDRPHSGESASPVGRSEPY